MKTTHPGLALALAMALIVAVGLDLRPSIASIGPLLPMLRADFQLSNAAVAVLTALPPLLMGLLALPAPWLAHRLGLTRTVLWALALVSLATLARAFSGSTAMLFAATIALSAGIAVAGALIGGFVKARFPDRAGLLMGIYVMSLGFGSTLAAGLTLPLVSLTEGWRIGAGIWAVLGVGAILAWWTLTRQAVPPTQTGRAALPLRNKTAWAISAYGAANSILFFGFLAWLVPMFLDLGAKNPGLILTSFTLGFMLANPLPGLSRTPNRRRQITLAGALALTGIMGIALVPGLPFVFVPMLALGIGASFTLGMTLALERAPDAHQATAWNAMSLAFGYGIGALGPLMVGVLHDLSGGYDLPLLAMAAVAAVMLALTPLLTPLPIAAKPASGVICAR